LKIAIIYPEILPSDKARSVTVVKTAATLGKIADVTLICEDSRESIDYICIAYGVEKKFHLVKLPKKALFFKSNKIFNYHLVNYLRKNSYDVVYVRHLKTAEALIKKGFTVVFEAHEVFADSAPKSKQKSVAKSEKFVYQNAIGIVFISETLRNEFESRFGSVRSIVLPLALNGQMKGANQKEFADIKEVYYVGSFQSWKGVDTLVRAAQYLKEGIKIKLVGSGGNEVELRELIKSLELENRVEFVGRLLHSEVEELLASKTKICVLPNNISIFDKFTSPLKLFEYMASFNAIVSSNIASIIEITNGVTCEFKAGDAVDLGEKLNYLVSNPAIAKSLAEAAYAKIREIEPSARAGKLINFFEETKC